MRNSDGVYLDLSSEENEPLKFMIGRVHHLSHIFAPRICEFCSETEDSVPLTEIIALLNCMSNANKEILEYLDSALPKDEYAEMCGHLELDVRHLTAVINGHPEAMDS